MQKKRILIVNEFSELSTGFATYMHYLLPRLYTTGKYEIAEHAIYTHCLHPRLMEVPWKVYPNEPDPRNQKEVEVYNQDRMNQFGKWRFEEICLDFKPHICVDVRDIFMCDWIGRSPYRKNFKFIHMTTCDGEPQKPEWLDHYRQADKLLTYSWWAKYLLEKQNVKVDAVASPCVDLEVFKPPADKRKLRQEIGLDPDVFIIQTVMRNQPRKLFPDLFRAFSKYLKLCEENGRHDLVNKSFLYCHTTYPDLGWDLPVELKRYGLSHKVLFTYMCDKCQSVYPLFFSGEKCNCKNCGTNNARFPNTSMGVDRSTLAKVMSVADLYVQYSVCEGWGMCNNDAKGCGVPVLGVDYSATSEQCYNGGGNFIPVKRFFQESIGQTGQLRALPDDDAAAKLIYEFAILPKAEKDKLSKEARECVEKYYNWDNIAKIWENIIDETVCPDQKTTWFAPKNLIQPVLQIPGSLDNTSFVHWCYMNILKRPDLINTHMVQKTIAALNVGYEAAQDESGRPIRIPLDRNKILQSLLGYVQHCNNMEELRYNTLVKGIKGPKLQFAEV